MPYKDKDKARESNRNSMRKRRESDPAYVEERKAACKKWREENPDYTIAKNAARRKRYAEDPAYKENTNRENVLKAYKTTPEQYEAQLAEQGGHCALCPAVAGKKRLHQDHDHACCPEKFTCGECKRGILCSVCNIRLAALEETLKEASVVAERHTWTRRALNYIEDYKKTWAITFPTDGVGVLDGICGTYLNSKDRVDVSTPRRFLAGQTVHIYDNKLQTQKCSSVIARISDNSLVFTEPLNGDVRCGDLIVMTQETQ